MSDAAYRERVGAELRRIRESIPVSGEDVAAALNWSQSKVSRVENAKISISMQDLATLLHYYGVPEEVRAELLSMNADETGLEGAWIVRAGGTTRRQVEVAAIETRVTTISQFHSGIVPGQLQSPSYARWLVGVGGFKDVEGIVRRRMARQQLLEQDGAPDYRAVLDARALLFWPGDSPDLVAEQISRLKARMSLPAVSVQIIPLSANRQAAALVPFLIYEFRTNSPTVVLAESQTADLYLSSPSDVETYQQLFTGLTADALSSEDSLDYLDDLVRDIEEITSRR
ncbi:helix-turn-helix domain-containing protein [Catellatospora chokoriensis]|uniref:Transcriptional regulator n=1 Tax=Catellatospora chokoriensis TaxID=310353 RepID=A0A8J3JYE8_9ACTN|nr:helix-turn-helix transcriptional regulator [Catellatospora chokoriensis]GIF89152.1 transcriptional regulator [Catellatospora chokoriensis]